MADPALMSLIMQMSANLLELNTSMLKMTGKNDRLDVNISSLKTDYVQFKEEVKELPEQVGKKASASNIE